MMRASGFTVTMNAALLCQAGGREFESRRSRHLPTAAPVAVLLFRRYRIMLSLDREVLVTGNRAALLAGANQLAVGSVQYI